MSAGTKELRRPGFRLIDHAVPFVEEWIAQVPIDSGMLEISDLIEINAETGEQVRDPFTEPVSANAMIVHVLDRLTHVTYVFNLTNVGGKISMEMEELQWLEEGKLIRSPMRSFKEAFHEKQISDFES